ESRYFTKVLRSKEAAAMIRSLFLSMQELNKGARRPQNVPPTKIKKVAVIGAGFMGASVGYVSARAGLDVVLIDRDQESADKGKAHAQKVIDEQIAKGRAKAADRDALLARITPTADYAVLKDCDLVIEAVFEDRKVKAETFAKAQQYLKPDAIFASNTSTLPITSLAESFKEQGKMAGMPVGPLSLSDEVALDLGLKVIKATEADLGPNSINPDQKKLMVELVEKQGRLGRKNSKGFYDYPEKGKGQKSLWPGLSALQPKQLDPDTLDVEELKQRFLVVQAVEAARTVEDHVITDPREADVGSILGFGFAPFTAGTLSYIDFMRTKKFVELCHQLE